jgi:hypothetical protein
MITSTFTIIFFSIFHVPMFPWKYFFSMQWEKRRGKQKRERERVVYIRGGSHTCVCVLLSFGNTLGAHTPTLLWVPLVAQENALVGEPPLEPKIPMDVPIHYIHPWLADEILEMI